MAIRADHIEQVLREAGRPVGVQELLRLAGLHPGQQTDLKRVMRELVRRGAVEKHGKRFTPAVERPVREAPTPAEPRGRGPLVEGTIHLHPAGYGFVQPTRADGEDVFVPPDEAQRVLDGDRVLVQPFRRGGRSAGRILKVLERRRQLVVGLYREMGKGAWVEPIEANVQGPIRVAKTQMARPGDMVKVRLGVGGGLLGRDGGLFGEVAGSLGKPGDPSAEVLSIAFAQGFNDEFPPEVMDEADAISLTVSAEEARGEGRRDLRGVPLVTIDGADARDFDDAIYVEERGEHWRLVVAIADVSHYVRQGTALDTEALRRATSVYLPDRVLPMLPERLSAGICSLVPEQDRLCMVADMVFDRSGQLRSYELYPGVMRSAARCTYDEVHRVLAGEDVPHRNAFRPLFERAMALAQTLTRMREQRGAIDFDLPETRIELDEEGRPVRLVKRERFESHRLIEECMLAANEAVARFFQDQELPCIYRFHGEPDEEKLAAFAALAQAHGFVVGTQKGALESKDLNALLEKLEGHPEQEALNQLLLRSMMQAVYSAEQVGHYGLAAEHYLHFTSPIRRYPDLAVHRLLKAHWARQGRPRSRHEVDTETEQLEKVAQTCSERERAAMQVEREVVSFYAALLMKDRVGEEFEATVASLTDFGFFVELDELFIEGLVRGETVEPRFKFDKITHAIVFLSGRKVRVGDKLRVRLVSVNTQRRQLDFEVVQFGQEKPLHRPRPAIAPQRPRPSPPPWEAPAPEQPGRSPHPGFDRLRALAARGKQKGRPEQREQVKRGAAGGRSGQKSRGAAGGGRPKGGPGKPGGGPRRKRR